MSKNYSNHLFQLIHAMSGPEKRYFKRFLLLHGGKETASGKLFDAYNRQPVFDERALKRSETYLSGFAQHKKYLFEMILRSLRSYHTGSTSDMKIKALVSDAEILRQMRLYDPGMAALKKAMRLAEQSGNQVAQLEVLRKMDELRFDARQIIAYADHETVFRKEKELLQRYGEIAGSKSRAKAFYSIYYMDFANRRKSSEKIKFPAGKPKSMPALRFDLSARTAQALMNGHTEKALQYAMENVKTVESNPLLIADYPHEYMKALSTQLVLEDLLQKHTNCLATISKLRQLHRVPALAKKLRAFESHTFVYTYTTEFNLLVQRARFTEVLQLIPLITRGLAKYESRITDAERKVFYQNFSLAFFYAGNARMAYRWSAKALNEMPLTRQDLNYQLIIVRLLATYERDDPDFFRVLLKKETLNLLDLGLHLEFTRKFLSLLKALAETSAAKEKQKLFMDFLEKLRVPRMKKTAAAPLSQVDLVSWMEGKLSGKTTAVVMASKA
ncbi:MAG: hypothetical protein FD123_2342 [Bacteroidetes bacterium]|nr:MAG: hypothetical protein FD123_2342 [Bacteroidota bacterium]